MGLPHALYLLLCFFFSDILDGYDNFCSTAKKLSSLLYELQRDHLETFSLTWLLLNKRMYQRYVYLVVQELIPDCILWLKEYLDADKYSAMANRLISFDEDMTAITQEWLIVWENLQKYHLTVADRKRRSMTLKLAQTMITIHDTQFPFKRYPKLKKNLSMSQWSKLENRGDAWLHMVDYIKREWNCTERCLKRLATPLQNKICPKCDSASISHHM